MSLTNKKLHIYEKQEDMGTDTPPQFTLELGQIYSVRTLEQGEHERVRVKPNDAKRVLQLAYIDQSDASNVTLPDKSDIGVSPHLEIFASLPICCLLIGGCGPR